MTSKYNLYNLYSKRKIRWYVSHVIDFNTTFEIKICYTYCTHEKALNSGVK